MKIETSNPIKIHIKGDEKFEFLQNIITNDLNKNDKKILTYILTPQGKIFSELQIEKKEDVIELICTNDQVDILNYLKKYGKLSDVIIEKQEFSYKDFDENYFVNNLSKGIVDSNFLPHSTLNPSEVNDDYIDYQKGCYVGQEVVSRIKHRQLQKKTLQVLQNISSNRKIEIKNLEILLEINEYLIARIAIKANFDSILKESGLKRIEVT